MNRKQIEEGARIVVILAPLVSTTTVMVVGASLVQEGNELNRPRHRRLVVAAVQDDELGSSVDIDCLDVVGVTAGRRNHVLLVAAAGVRHEQDVVRVARRSGCPGNLSVDVELAVAVGVTQGDCPAVSVAPHSPERSHRGAETRGSTLSVLEAGVVAVHQVVDAVPSHVADLGAVHVGQTERSDVDEPAAGVAQQRRLLVGECQRQQVGTAVVVVVPLQRHPYTGVLRRNVELRRRAEAVPRAILLGVTEVDVDVGLLVVRVIGVTVACVGHGAFDLSTDEQVRPSVAVPVGRQDVAPTLAGLAHAVLRREVLEDPRRSLQEELVVDVLSLDAVAGVAAGGVVDVSQVVAVEIGDHAGVSVDVRLGRVPGRWPG